MMVIFCFLDQQETNIDLNISKELFNAWISFVDFEGSSHQMKYLSDEKIE